MTDAETGPQDSFHPFPGDVYPDAPFRLSDPFFHRIPLTAYDRLLINDPRIQRLRHLTHRPAIQYTFPSCSFSRFAHALGTMHIAGKLFSSALCNATTSTLRSFCHDLNELMTWILEKNGFSGDPAKEPQLLSSWANHRAFGNAAGVPLERFLHNKDHDHPDIPLLRTTFALNILWQAIRFASIARIVGHLPFDPGFHHALNECLAAEDPDSNSFLARKLKEKNSALESRLCKDLALHSCDMSRTRLTDRVGIAVILEILDKKPEGSHCLSLIRAFTALAFVSGKSSIYARPDPQIDCIDLLNCLGIFFDGDIAPANLDSTLRVSQALGTPAALRFERILDSCILARAPGRGYAFHFNSLATPSLEQYMARRQFLCFEVLRHHHVARMVGAIKETVIRMLHFSGFATHPGLEPIREEHAEFLQPLQESLSGLLSPPSSLNNEVQETLGRPLETLDDPWFLETLRSALKAISSILINEPPEPVAQDLSRLHLLLDTILNSRYNNYYSLWNKPSEYKDLAKDLVSELKRDGRNSPQDEPNPLAVHHISIKKVQDVLTRAHWQTPWLSSVFLSPLRRDLKAKGVIVLYRNIGISFLQSGYSATSSGVFFEYPDGKVLDAIKASPLLKAFRELPGDYPGFQLSFVSAQFAAGDRRGCPLAQECRSSAIQHLANLITRVVASEEGPL